MMKSITKIMLEFIEIGKGYRETNDERERQGYEDYVQTIINNDIKPEDRNSIESYWEGLKKGG